MSSSSSSEYESRFVYLDAPFGGTGVTGPFVDRYKITGGLFRDNFFLDSQIMVYYQDLSDFNVNLSGNGWVCQPSYQPTYNGVDYEGPLHIDAVEGTIYLYEGLDCASFYSHVGGRLLNGSDGEDGLLFGITNPTIVEPELPSLNISSSSSDNLDSESSYSSSSESSELLTKDLYRAVIVQNHNVLIPFICYGEGGFSSNEEILFNIDVVPETFGYLELIANSNSKMIVGSNNETTYVPEDEESQYQHDPVIFVDIIAKDDSGIKSYNLRSQVNNYRYEDIRSSFNIPKFSWDDGVFGDPISDDAKIEGSVWIGTDDKTIHNVQYDANEASVNYTSNVSSEVRNIIFDPLTSKTFISQYDHLSRFLIDSYYGTTTIVEAEEDLTILNNDNDIISLIKDNSILSVQSYSGKVISRSENNMLPQIEYGGFDAPNKVKWSSYHNAFLISGTSILWKLENGVKESVYNLNGFRINDFDIAPSGEVALMLGGEDYDIIRVIGRDFYKFLVNEKIEEGVASKATYCEQGIFHLLIELNSGIGAYQTIHYLFDVKSKSLSKHEFESDVVTTTTTTTALTTTNKIEIDKPSSGEILEIGSEKEIIWRSIESANDTVKIELYESDKLIDVIVSETKNSGIYKWNISEAYAENDEYKIKITWLSANNSTDNFDFSEVFTLTDVAITTTTTTTQIVDKAIGSGYNPSNNDVVIVLGNGLMGYFDIEEKQFYGLFDSTVANVTCMAVKDEIAKNFDSHSKIRVFVGTDKHLSDKWDSGVIETELSSIYYGGGNNLIPGEKYYVNVQVYDETLGWSKVQTKEWIMPK